MKKKKTQKTVKSLSTAQLSDLLPLNILKRMKPYIHWKIKKD